MKYEPWMTCEVIASDGSFTIGHVCDGAARWAGSSTLAEGDEFEYVDNDEEFRDENAFQVQDGVWQKVPEGARTLFLNGVVRMRNVSPEQLEAVGHRLFVNGSGFAATLREEGAWIDPIDGKRYEWR